MGNVFEADRRPLDAALASRPGVVLLFVDEDLSSAISPLSGHARNVNPRMDRGPTVNGRRPRRRVYALE